MKKLLTALLAALTGWGTLSAALTGDYLFKLQIDDVVKDSSGNNRHPLNSFGETSWYQGDLEGVSFRNKGDAIRLPAAAFALPKGKAELVVRTERLTPGQQILRLYSKGDGFVLDLYKGNRLRAAFYHRKTKKWASVVAKNDAFPAKKWVRITVTYTLPGEMRLYLDNELAGKCALDFPLELTKDTQLLLGNNQIGTGTFLNGVIHRATFSDVPDAPKNAAVKVIAAPKNPHRFTLGNSVLEFPKAPDVFALTSWRYGDTELVSPLRRDPLWRITLFNRKTGKKSGVDAGNGAPKLVSGKDGLEMRWEKLALPTGEKFTVTARVKLANADTLHWTLETSELPDPWAVDTVAYPVIACAPTSEDPQKMFLTYPVYYGRNKIDPFTFGKPRPGMRWGNFYPGGAHMQFCFLYSDGRPGIYITTPDSNGNCKDFLFIAQPQDKALVFNLEQYPRQRLISRKFVSAYPVVTGVMTGDWYDAARRYRRWAVQQPWCAQGKLVNRADLPKWAKEIDLATRPNNLKWGEFGRDKYAEAVAVTRENNRFIRDLFSCDILQVWYGYHHPADWKKSTGCQKRVCPFNGWTASFPVDGVKEAIAASAKQKFHTIGYLNSRIYDQSLAPNDPETKSIQPAVMREYDGRFQLYGRKVYDVCRHDKRWQDHLLKIIKRHTAALGMAGMYMDSFGRGQQFCWADNHGHLPGDSTAAIAGQLEMARKIRREMRAIDPEFVLSSEASTEPFVGVIDFKLYHYNLHLDCVPLWAAVYHDYQLTYGRTAGKPRHNSTALFHVGGIMGRVFTSQNDIKEAYFPEGVPEFYRQLFALRKEFRDRIGLGEMLRPPMVKCDAKPEAGRKDKSEYSAPAIFSSAWRNEAGEVALFFTNSQLKPVEFEFKLKGAEFDPVRKNKWVLIVPDGKTGDLTRQPWTGGKYILQPLATIAIECGK